MRSAPPDSVAISQGGCCLDLISIYCTPDYSGKLSNPIQRDYLAISYFALELVARKESCEGRTEEVGFDSLGLHWLGSLLTNV